MIAKSPLSFLAAAVFAFAVFGIAPVLADSLDDYRSRGFITERYDGYTQVRGDAPPGALALVAEVNEKRAAIYIKRAKAQGIPVEEVAKIYAMQIFNEAPAGTWFLQPDGKYVKK